MANDYVKIVQKGGVDAGTYAEFEGYRSDNTGGSASFLTVGWKDDGPGGERVISLSPEEALQIAAAMIEFATRELT